MPRIKLSRLELVQKFVLTIRIAFARHSSVRSDLLNPRETEAAERRRDFAVQRLSEYLVSDLETSKHEVTREAVNEADEAILERLREAKQRRES